jgi:hypothetical protein
VINEVLTPTTAFLKSDSNSTPRVVDIIFSNIGLDYSSAALIILS